ncbi:MAG: PD40 domain-containing protein [Algicola sp.]|nr:PD40 domain-containing protein [Algicola sp.]
MKHNGNTSLLVGQWLVLPEQNSIIKDQQKKSIEPQCMALLIYLCDRPGQVISRNELLDALWQGIVVNENTLTKTVAMLRQALGDDVKQPRYIATRLKKGYQLIAKVAVGEPPTVQDETTTLIQSTSHATLYNATLSFVKKRTLYGLLILAVIVFVFWQALPSDNSNATYNKFIPVTAGLGIERDPNFSPDGQLLIYAERKDENADFDLMIYSVKDKSHHKASHFTGDELAPAWSPDGSKIAYFLKNNGHCSLYVTDFNGITATTLKPGKKVADCGYNNEGQIAWSGNDSIVYSDRNINTMGEHKLYQLQLGSQYRKRITDHYPLSFALSKNKRHMALLVRANSQFELDIHRFSFATKSAEPWLLGLPAMTEFAWFSDSERLLVSDIYHGKLSIIGSDTKQQLLYQSNSMFSQPVVSPDNSLIALVQSSVKSNIYELANPLVQSSHQLKLTPDNDDIQKSKPLVESSYFDYLHQYSHRSDTAAFLSNRNGEHQLWLSTKGVERAVDIRMADHSEILDFHWSQDDTRILLFMNNGKMLLYSVTQDTVSELEVGNEPVYYPVWDNKGDAVLYSKMTDIGPKLWRLDLASKIRQPIKKTHAVSIVASPDERFFYLLKTTPGLWQKDRQSGKETLIVKNVDISAWGSMVVFNDGIYWREDSATGYDIRHYELNTKKTSTLLSIPQATMFNMRYFDVSPRQENISFYQMSDYQSDLVFLGQ